MRMSWRIFITLIRYIILLLNVSTVKITCHFRSFHKNNICRIKASDSYKNNFVRVHGSISEFVPKYTY